MTMPTPDSRAMSRHPFQLWALFAFVVGGVGALLGPPPGSVDELVPDPWRIAWAVILVAGGVFGLLAAVLRDRLDALLLERVALFLLIGGTAPYAVAVAKLAGWSGFLSCCLLLSVTVAAGRRTWQVSKSLEAMRRLLEQQRETRAP